MRDIADLYRQFNPMKPLTADAADRALYVDWQRELRGSDDDVKLRLARGIARSGGQAVTHLFTGPRGVGKTTELYRVKHLLESGTLGKKFFVSMLMAEQWLDLSDYQPEELSFQIVRQLVEDLKEAKFRPSGTVQEFFNKLGVDFSKRLGLDTVELGVDPMLKVTFKNELIPYDTRRQFRELLQGQLPRIYDLVNGKLIKEARTWLARVKKADDILIIVDEVDRTPRLGDNHEDLFIGRAGILRALDCHVLYTMPIDLLYSPRQQVLSDIYGTEILTLPVMPVLKPSGTINSEGRKALREIVYKRAAAAQFKVTEIFESEDLLDEVLSASGGQVRTLIVLLRSMLNRVAALPVTKPTVERDLRERASMLSRPLSRRDWSVLKEVHDTKQPVNGGSSEVWSRLLRDSYILTYYDDEALDWYDWDPVLTYANAKSRP